MEREEKRADSRFLRRRSSLSLLRLEIVGGELARRADSSSSRGEEVRRGVARMEVERLRAKPAMRRRLHPRQMALTLPCREYCTLAKTTQSN